MSGIVYRPLQIKINDSDFIEGDLHVPEKARGIVIFSHGSGSSRFSPRNRFVAESLQKNGFATFLVDLLTEEEDKDYNKRFDIDLLTSRLLICTDWVNNNKETRSLPIGYFGASTGAASAIKAAVASGNIVKALVSRGGRPDLAMNEAKNIQAPSLLIVGSLDRDVIALNNTVFKSMSCIKQMIIIEGASHLFEEPGKLEEVAKNAVNWFDQYLK